LCAKVAARTSRPKNCDTHFFPFDVV